MFVVRVWGAIERGNDTEYYCVLCEGHWRAIESGTDSESYCDCCDGLGSAIDRN